MSKKPEGIPEDVINAMCLTWRHDFGLNAPAPDSGGRMAWSDGAAMGMTQAQKDGLRMQMRQLYQHHVLPAIQAAVEAEREQKEVCLKALNDIAQVDEVDLVLDPHWAIRVAGAAIREVRAIRKRGEG